MRGTVILPVETYLNKWIPKKNLSLNINGDKKVVDPLLFFCWNDRRVSFRVGVCVDKRQK